MSTPTPTPATEPEPATPDRRRRSRVVYVAIGAVLLVFALAVAAAAGAFSGSHHTTSPSAVAPSSAPGNGGLINTDGGEIPQPISTPAIPTSTAAAPTAFPEPFSAVAPVDPVAVMRAGLASMFTYLAGDVTQLDAAHRAAPLIAPPGVDDGFLSLAPITGGQWSRWRHDRDAVTASVTVPAKNDNPDTATSASRIASVTQRVIDPRGTVIDTLPALTVYTTATKQPGGEFKIAKVTVQQ